MLPMCFRIRHRIYLKFKESENGKKLLIPKVDQFVLDIDAEKREITVRLIEGMLDL